jgi:hypothetical protein
MNVPRIAPPAVTNTDSPHTKPELAAPGAQRGGERERAPALVEPDPERQARRGDGEDEGDCELDPGQPGHLDCGQVRADDVALGDDVGDPGAGADDRAHPAGDGRRAHPVGPDEEGADRVGAGRAGDVPLVGDKERVLGCGRELLGDADVVERHRPELLGPAVLQAQPQEVARPKLEVVDRLDGREDAVGPAREPVHELRRGPAREPAVLDVLELAGVGDRSRAHAVEVLEVGADRGEPVLQGLDAPRARTRASRTAAPGPTRAPGDSVTVTSAPLVRRASASACCW